MKNWATALFLIIVFIIQFSVLGIFFAARHAPNVFVLLSICLVVIFGFQKSWPWIIAGGLMMDAGAGWLLGSGTLVLVLTAWLVDALKIVAELRFRRYIFLVLLALLFAFSTIFFDFLIRVFVAFEKQIGITKIVLSNFQLDKNYGIKIIISIFSGLIIYYFSRMLKTSRNSGNLARR